MKIIHNFIKIMHSKLMLSSLLVCASKNISEQHCKTSFLNSNDLILKTGKSEI